MRFLSIHIPAQPMSGPPTSEDMAKMGQLMEESMRSGKLVFTGGLKKRETAGFTLTRTNGAYKIDTAPQTAWMRGGGFAILETASREEAIAEVKKFMEIAGDGVSEIIEISTPTP